MLNQKIEIYKNKKMIKPKSYLAPKQTVKFLGDTKTYVIKNLVPDKDYLFVTLGAACFRKSVFKITHVNSKEITIAI